MTHDSGVKKLALTDSYEEHMIAGAVGAAIGGVIGALVAKDAAQTIDEITDDIRPVGDAPYAEKDASEENSSPTYNDGSGASGQHKEIPLKDAVSQPEEGWDVWQ